MRTSENTYLPRGSVDRGYSPSFLHSGYRGTSRSSRTLFTAVPAVGMVSSCISKAFTFRNELEKALPSSRLVISFET
jgi:hypothetical protein